MIQAISIKVHGFDLAGTIRSVPTKDANLLSCLVYLAVNNKQIMQLRDIGIAFNVSGDTVRRWCYRLWKMGIINLSVVKSDSGVGQHVWNASIGGIKNATDPSLPLTIPLSLNVVHSSRVMTALKTVKESCHTISKRADDGEIESLLNKVVMNAMFNSVNLDKELKDADAWLIESKMAYRDMTKFMMNWFRRSAKKYMTKNANPSPSKNKYDHLHRRKQ